MSGAAPDEDRPITRAEWLTLGALGLLYFVQGLPFGYQADALPMTLRAQGHSFTAGTITQALALPWALKIFAGPFVDAFGSRRFGHRKSFILPLQLALAATMAAAYFLPIERSIVTLAVLLVGMNLFAATMDVAVDGLAVDTLRARTFGLGNAVQVAGFRLGMIVSGGVLVHALPFIGLRGLFATLSVLTLVVHAITWTFPERERETPAAKRAPFDLRGTIRATWASITAVEGRALVLYLFVYKAGEAIADSLFRPMLIDSHFSVEEIALYVNTYGSASALIGPLLAGLLVVRFGVKNALLAAIFVRVLPLVGELSIAAGFHSHAFVLGVTLVEHLVGSALTTLTFAMMMTVVDPRVGATQFTALATLENMGKGTLGYLAGPLADGLGLVGTYAIAVLLTLAFTIAAPRLVTKALDVRKE